MACIYQFLGLSFKIITIFVSEMSMKSSLYQAPAQEERWGRLRREGDKIKFIDVRCERWQVVGKLCGKKVMGNHPLTFVALEKTLALSLALCALVA